MSDMSLSALNLAICLHTETQLVAMSTSAFFTDSMTVMQRTVDVGEELEKPQNIVEQFEVNRCADFINKNAFNKVALQFPDDLLHLSATLASILQSKTSAIVFILGDTSYGSCCVDEVAAQHAGADAIIHFGPACLSPTKRFPVLYVFGHGGIDLEKCSESFRSLVPDRSQHVLVLSDVIHSHAIDELQKRLQEDYANVVFSSINTTPVLSPEHDISDTSSLSGVEGLDCQCNSGTCCSKGQSNKQSGKTADTSQASVTSKEDNETRTITKEKRTIEEGLKGEDSEGKGSRREDREDNFFGRTLNLKPGTCLEDYAVFYIGGESRTLTNFMMVLNRSTFYTFDPVTCRGRRETLNVNRALMQRYHLVEKAKDANVVGILAGTLGVANYLDIISHLKQLLKHAGKKSYVFAVGKLNVPKLANFMEVDVYVLVACPENSLVDSKEFYRPVVTPFEMDIACNEAREWTGEYITDFQTLLPGSSKHIRIPTSSSASERTDVSLVTGKLRSLGAREDDDGGNQLMGGSGDAGALVSRDEALTVSNIHKNASEYLMGRSWQGLEQKLGETPVTKATEGRKGIAAGYTHEET